MPRLTHPRPLRKHDRGHIRFQRERYELRRWRQARDRYDNWPFGAGQPQVIAQDRTVNDWPFNLPSGRFSRNVFTRCSCELCSAPAHERRADRRRANRVWRQQEDEAE